MSHVFISYKREDQPIAKALARELEAHSISVWWDIKLRAGEHFDDEIEKAIQTASCVIVIWSAKSVESRFVKDEANLALRLNKIVPVAIDESLPPFRFQSVHTISLVGSNTRKIENLDALLANLQPHVNLQANLQAPKSDNFLDFSDNVKKSRKAMYSNRSTGLTMVRMPLTLITEFQSLRAQVPDPFLEPFPNIRLGYAKESEIKDIKNDLQPLGCEFFLNSSGTLIGYQMPVDPTKQSHTGLGSVAPFTNELLEFMLSNYLLTRHNLEQLLVELNYELELDISTPDFNLPFGLNPPRLVTRGSKKLEGRKKVAVAGLQVLDSQGKDDSRPLTALRVFLNRT